MLSFPCPPVAAFAPAPAACASCVPLPRALMSAVATTAGPVQHPGSRLADMKLDVPVQDESKSAVMANGLPPRHGAQLAVDATIVSPRHWLQRRATRGADFLCLLARQRDDESTSAMLRPAARAAWLLPWSGLLAVAAQRAELR